MLGLFFLCLIKSNNAQNNLSISTKSFFNDLKACKNERGQYVATAELTEKYALYKQDGIVYVSGLAKVSDNSVIKALREKKCIINTQIKDIITLRVPLGFLDKLSETKGLIYVELGRKVKPNLKDALKDTRADSVQAGIGLPQAYSGKGVIIGETDWGFDYTHPTFYDTSLTHLRIVRAWDQYKLSGPAPAAYTYGTEYATEQELLTAQHDTSNIYGLHTHGTHTSGIAAGNGAGTPYRGFAYGAEIVMVTILVDEASVLDAFNYIYNYASSAGKPVVINMSWGLYYMGTLDGTSLISQSLDYLSGMGMTFVSSAGNNGDVNFHIKKEFGPSVDTLRTFVAFEPYAQIPTMWGQSISMWGTPNTSFKYGLEIYNNTNNLMLDLPLYNTVDGVVLDTNVIIANDTITYRIESEASNPFNQRPGVRLRVRNLKTSTYNIAVKVVSDTATVHLWNLIELVNDVGNWGAAFTNPIANTTAGDTYYGIGEPTCAASVITVGAYRAQVTLPNGHTYYGNISSFSSKGPLINEVIKPDITAPGANVVSAISSFYNGTPVSTITNVTFNGKIYKFGPMSGTSMSIPVVAGIAGLLLEVNPSLTPAQIKNLLKQTARHDSYTGVISSAGDVLWGWGKVNAYHAARIAAGLSGCSNNTFLSSDFKIFPNPTYGVAFLEGFIEGNYSINIYDVNGKNVYNAHKTYLSQQFQINFTLLKRGIYTVLLESDKNNYIQKLILQ